MQTTSEELGAFGVTWITIEYCGDEGTIQRIELPDQRFVRGLIIIRVRKILSRDRKEKTAAYMGHLLLRNYRNLWNFIARFRCQNSDRFYTWSRSKAEVNDATPDDLAFEGFNGE